MHLCVYVNTQVRYLSISTDTFNPNNLKASIQLNGKNMTWSLVPGYKESANGNLLGTLRVSEVNHKICKFCLN